MWIEAIMNSATAARPSIPSPLRKAETTGTSNSVIKPPPSTTNSGVIAVSTTPRSQPAVSPRVPENSARTTNTGPSASKTAKAIRAVTKTPTVPSSNNSAPSHIRLAGVKLPAAAFCIEPPCPPPAASAVSATAAKIRSIRSANICVAEPLAPSRIPAI